jgi:uncharacterized protein (TIGR03435 family)
VGVEGDVVVVDVERDGRCVAGEEAEGNVGEGADEARGLGGGLVGEVRVHDLFAVDPADWYLIEAKTDKTDASKDEMAAVLKSLLADRFKLQVRQETKEFDVYNLVVAKGGPKLKSLAKDEDQHCTRDNTFVCGITNPEQLARSLKYRVGRPVMDKRGSKEGTTYC